MNRRDRARRLARARHEQSQHEARRQALPEMLRYGREANPPPASPRVLAEQRRQRGLLRLFSGRVKRVSR